MDERSMEEIRAQAESACSRDWHAEALYWWRRWYRARGCLKMVRQRNRALGRLWADLEGPDDSQSDLY